MLLLDIELEGGDGFDIIRSIPGEMPIVIFTTAYDSYALQAFEAQALDYLLKPFDQERLHRALERAKTEMTKSAKGALNDNLASLLSAARKPHAENRLIIKSGGRVVFIQLDEIDYTKRNFVHADMSPDEFAASMKKKGESLWNMIWKAMQLSMAH